MKDWYGRFYDGFIKRELIEVKEKDRCTGKTTQLIEFGKRSNCIVVKGDRSDGLIEYLRQKFDYQEIYSVNQLETLKPSIRQVVIDEEVNIDDIPRGYNVVTGYKRVKSPRLNVGIKNEFIELLEDCSLDLKVLGGDIEELYENYPFLNIDIEVDIDKEMFVKMIKDKIEIKFD
jgi:hypothetical protein